MHRLITAAIAALVATALVSAVTASAREGGESRGGDRSQNDRGSGGAGTIASFTGGVLTLKLADDSDLAGRVTGRTDVECDHRARSSRENEPGDDRGDDRNGGDDDPSGDDRGGDDGGGDRNGGGDDPTGDDRGGNDRNRGGGDRGSDDRGNKDRNRRRDDRCGRADLKAGASVHKAELRVSSRGKVWDEVELAG